jgi:alkylhydroperoxidase family enzyme
LSDRDILDLTLIVGYFNFVNRIATGLGVEFSAEELSGYLDE